MIPIFEYSLADTEKKKKTKAKQQKKNPQQEKKVEKKKEKKNQNVLAAQRREEQLREFMGYFRNQIIEKDQRKKPNQQDDMVDGFLNVKEFDEIRRNYGDISFGDIIIQFPNPDKKEIVQNKAINFRLAEQCFDSMLTVLTDEGFSKAQLKHERESFMYSFLLLKDYEGKSDAKKKSKKDKEKEKKKQQKLTKSEKERNPYLKYIEALKQLEEQQNEAEKNDEIGKDNNNKDKEKQEDGIDLWNELINLNLSESSYYKSVHKSFSDGGFMYLKSYDDDDDTDWVCYNNQPKDFLTLVRNTIMAKFCRNANLHCRQFISLDGNNIFMIVKSNEDTIRKEAEASGQTKQLELGYADLFSLEPCDKLFRPLRLKKEVRNAVIQLRKTIKGKLNFNKDDKMGHHKKIDEQREKVYEAIRNWDEKELWLNIAKKQIEIDTWMEDLAKRLKIDMSHEKTGIIKDDEGTKREEWDCYYLYLCYLIDFGKRIKRLRNFAETDVEEQNRRKGNDIIQQNEGFLYKLIFRKAVGDSNEIYHMKNGYFSSSKILKTLWDRLGMNNPVAPFTDYFSPNDPKEDRIWRRYEVNEKHLRSMFLNMEKIKMTYSIMLKQVNLSRLMKDQYIIAYYPLHDPYQLKGMKKTPIFQSLVKAGLLDEQEPTESENKLSDMFKDLEDEAESTDFDAESVEEETKIVLSQPWHLQIDTLRDYFGEKVALYFRFLSFYTYNLTYMSVVAIIAQVLQDYADSRTASIYNVLFSMIIIIWSTVFIELWKREQVLFSVAFGQQDFEEDEAERPAFTGVYMRSVTNDDLNEEYYSPFKRKMKMLFSVFISFIIIGCAIACVFIIFMLKIRLINCGKCLPPEIILDNNSLPATLNSIQIVIFNTIYSIVGDKLNDYENHKILSSYENSLIAKVYMFTFFNTFNSCFFIAFLSSYFEELQLCRFHQDLPPNCFTQLSSQISNIFIVNFFKNIPELITPFIKALAKQKARTIDLKPVVHPFNKIDEFIEDQSLLEPYITNEEVDGTVADYMELVIQFSFLTLFGLSFPASYALALFNNFLEIQVDKMKMIKFSRRPMPAGACNIGTWLLILDVITFLSIFSNAGLIAYTSDSIPDNKIVIFSILLISFLGIKYFLRFVIPDTPETALIVNKRHKVAVDRVVKGFQKSKTKIYKTAKLNFNIGGVIYDHGQENQRLIQEKYSKKQQQQGNEQPQTGNIQNSAREQNKDNNQNEQNQNQLALKITN